MFVLAILLTHGKGAIILWRAEIKTGAHYQEFGLAILISALPSITAGGYISFLAAHSLNGSCLDRSEKGIYG